MQETCILLKFISEKIFSDKISLAFFDYNDTFIVQRHKLIFKVLCRNLVYYFTKY